MGMNLSCLFGLSVVDLAVHLESTYYMSGVWGGLNCLL